MAYFLKKTKTKHDVYLQFYEVLRSGSQGRSSSVGRPVGYVKKLIESGIDDPIAHFQKEVDRMNAKHKEQQQKEKARQISEESPERFLGYFPIKNMNDGLHVKRWIDLMQSVTGFRFNVYELIASLIYARLVMPCSKRKTYDDVLPLSL